LSSSPAAPLRIGGSIALERSLSLCSLHFT